MKVYNLFFRDGLTFFSYIKKKKGGLIIITGFSLLKILATPINMYIMLVYTLNMFFENIYYFVIY